MSRITKSNPKTGAFLIKGASVLLEKRVLIVNQVWKAMRDRIRQCRGRKPACLVRVLGTQGSAAASNCSCFASGVNPVPD